jgi:four helix bundle protein
MLDHTKLRVWQQSHFFALAVHHAAKDRSAASSPGLAAQLRRSAASIPANIAEGSAQPSPAQCVRFLDIALGSASETENHLAFAQDTGMLSPECARELTADLREVRRMLIGFRKWVQRPQRT